METLKSHFYLVSYAENGSPVIMENHGDEFPLDWSAEDLTPIATRDHKKVHNGILLVPCPLDDPRDPLNWPFQKKCLILAILSVAMFAGYAAPFCGQLNLTQQAELYNKTVVQITYFNSASSAGLATGGWFYAPFAHKFGRSSIILWAIVGCLVTQIWAPLMTGENQYNAYFASRFFAGFFGNVVSVLGPQYLVDLFFFHQRGRAFTTLHLALSLGAAVGPTFSGFIAANGSWTLEYWWSVALLGLAAILIFLFLEETGFDRKRGAINVTPPDTFLKNRIYTFFPGSKIVKSTTLAETVKVGIMPLKIAIAPVILMIAGFDMISFAFFVALNAFTPIWLQKPVKDGGWGFTIQQNAAFTFVHWIALLFGFTYGQLVSDKLPVWLCTRRGGVWKPEYRLHVLWITSLILMPIGLGLVGATLQYHLHWMNLAFGSFLVTIGSLVSIPVTVNYIAECFRSHTVEATIPVNSMRLFLGLSINFFMNGWIAQVGIGWVFGMMAFFSIFAFFFLIILMWKGHVIRGWTPFGMGSDEEGERVLEEKPAHSL